MWRKSLLISDRTLTQDQWSSEVQKSFFIGHIFPIIDNHWQHLLFQFVSGRDQITRLQNNPVTAVEGQGRTRRQPDVDSLISFEVKRVEIVYHSHRPRGRFFLKVNFCVKCKRMVTTSATTAIQLWKTIYSPPWTDSQDSFYQWTQTWLDWIY